MTAVLPSSFVQSNTSTLFLSTGCNRHLLLVIFPLFFIPGGFLVLYTACIIVRIIIRIKVSLLLYSWQCIMNTWYVCDALWELQSTVSALAITILQCVIYSE